MAPTNKVDDERIWTRTDDNERERKMTNMNGPHVSIHCWKHSTMATKRRTPHADKNEQWGSPIIKKVCTFACQLTWVLTTCKRPGNHISTALSSIGRAGSLDVVYIFTLFMYNNISLIVAQLLPNFFLTLVPLSLIKASNSNTNPWLHHSLFLTFHNLSTKCMTMVWLMCA